MRRFGLLGERLSHSFSPMIHAELGDYPYALYEKKPEELEHFLRHGRFDGLNVTIPYKKAVMPFCAALLCGVQRTISISYSRTSLPSTVERMVALPGCTILRAPTGSPCGYSAGWMGWPIAP